MKLLKKTNKKITFLEIFIKSIIVFVVSCFHSKLEKEDLTIAKYKIKTKKDIEKNIKIVFLSDLHDKDFGNNNKKILDMIDAQNPDIILIGGDMLTVKDMPVNIDNTISLCSNLSKRYKIYYGVGNHEERLKEKKYKNTFEIFVNKLRELGVVYLDDISVLLSENINISSLNIDKKYYQKIKFPNMDKSYIVSKLGKINKEKFNILLAHSPNFLEAYESWGADLVLCGHFHGGTIRLNEEIGLMTPQIQFFNTNVVGHKVKKNTNMIISSGMGTHSINIRINNKPQIVVVDILKDID